MHSLRNNVEFVGDRVDRVEFGSHDGGGRSACEAGGSAARSDNSSTHEIVLLNPKPRSEEARSLVAQYFNYEAASYDDYDLSIPKRGQYTETIDTLASEVLRREHASRVISFAAGTGRRELRIKERSETNPIITCVDVAPQMCARARARGFDTVCGDMLSAEVDDSRPYDAAMCLYSFGQLPDLESRQQALYKVNSVLRFGGTLLLDVFNLHDCDEWGPTLIRRFCSERWFDLGYELGDVFYTRVGSNLLSFCHYFTSTEVCLLLKTAGFRVESVLNVGYAADTGKVLHTPMRGKMFIEARKIFQA